MASHPRIRRALLLPLVIGSGYAMLLLRPQLLFAHEVRAENVVLHARTALPVEAAAILAGAQQRVKHSPFYSPADTYDVFLCDTPALFALFAPLHRTVGGIADVYITRHVFLRPAHVERDRLVGASGNEPSGD